MINELLFMNGYGVYVLSAFSFTLLSFAVLYLTSGVSTKGVGELAQPARTRASVETLAINLVFII